MAKTRFAAPWHTLLSRLRKNTHCLGVMHFLNHDCTVGTFLARSQNHFLAQKLVRPIGKSVEKIERQRREAKYMRERWANVLIHDPYYSPNLSLELADFSYAQ
ncbi:MAG: hypothetical protein P1V13_22775 [Rhizobiaceae bacterium]|nr:hypothetical protein [Rhizobiaceae bacterium]